MNPSNSYTEDALVEHPAIDLFQELGYTTANLFYETHGESGSMGRDTRHDVVLRSRLWPALEKLESPGVAE